MTADQTGSPAAQHPYIYWCEGRWSEREDGAAVWANVSWRCEDMLTWGGQCGHMLRCYPSQLIDCLIWPYRTCLWKICSNNFEPEYPPNSQTSFVLTCSPMSFPHLTLGVGGNGGGWQWGWGGGGHLSYLQRPLLLTVLVLSSGRGEKKVLSFVWSPFLFIPPVGCVMLVDLLQMYHTLTSTQKMRLICWEHDWKLPGRSLNAVGLTQWKVHWIKVTQQDAAVWTIPATFFLFFFFFTNKLHIVKIIHVAIAISILFLKS